MEAAISPIRSIQAEFEETTNKLVECVLAYVDQRIHSLTEGLDSEITGTKTRRKSNDFHKKKKIVRKSEQVVTIMGNRSAYFIHFLPDHKTWLFDMTLVTEVGCLERNGLDVATAYTQNGTPTEYHEG
jgi:hypothetical protein